MSRGYCSGCLQPAVCEARGGCQGPIQPLPSEVQTGEDRSELRKLQEIIDNQADRMLDLNEILKAAYALHEFIAGAYILSLADFRYLNIVSTRIKAALSGDVAQAVQEPKPDIIGVLRSVHSALDDALGDTDVSHIENDDELRDECPVQWAAGWLAHVIELLEDSSPVPSAQEKSPAKQQGNWARVTEPCRHQNCEFPACDCEWDPIPSAPSASRGTEV